MAIATPFREKRRRPLEVKRKPDTAEFSNGVEVSLVVHVTSARNLPHGRVMSTATAGGRVMLCPIPHAQTNGDDDTAPASLPATHRRQTCRTLCGVRRERYFCTDRTRHARIRIVRSLLLVLNPVWLSKLPSGSKGAYSFNSSSFT